MKLNTLRPLVFFGLIAVMLSATQKKGVAQYLTADTIIAEPDVKIHSPHKATVYSAILPGLGQIYNKKYWKLPILYAGVGISIYAISWNTDNYKKYKNGFRDFSQFYDFKYQPENVPEGDRIPEPESKSYEDILDRDFDNTPQNFDNWFKAKLQNRKDSFKHDRDLSYIILALFHVASIIDATVDAHFTNFNVNDDLTIKVEPAVNYSAFSGNMVGFNCRITF